MAEISRGVGSGRVAVEVDAAEDMVAEEEEKKMVLGGLRQRCGKVACALSLCRSPFVGRHEARYPLPWRYSFVPVCGSFALRLTGDSQYFSWEEMIRT